MKTKISHLGRSTVSVILAVMMLLSTMLIGTVSTVNATTIDSGSNDFYLIGGMNKWNKNDSNWKLSTTDNNKYTGTFTISGSSSYTEFKVFSNDKYYTNEHTYDNDSVYGGLYEGGSKNNMQIKPATTDTSKSITLNVVFYKSYNDGSSDDSRLEIKQTVVGSSATSTYYVAGESGLVNGNSWTAAQESDKMSYNADGYYSITYTDRNRGTYKFKITDASNWYSAKDFSKRQGTGCTISGSDNDISVTLTQKSNVTIKFNIDSENKKNLYVIAKPASPNHTVTYDLGTGSTGKGSVSAVLEGTATSIGTSPASVEEGKSVTFKATANDGFKFVGWYSDADCTKAIENATDATYTTPVTADTTVYAKFVVTQGTQYSVSVAPNIANGTISVNNSNPYGGDTVIVTATPDPDFVLDTVTFNGESANVVGNTATFTMPNADVTVTATFRRAKEYTVTIASDITYGTVTANESPSEITVTEGTPVKLVATPNDSYSFSSWSITPPSGYKADGSMTSATATIYPKADITVSASFEQSTVSTDHFLAWGDKEQFSIGNWTHGVITHSSTDKDGYTVYTAELDPSFFEQNAWYCFAVTNKIPTSDDRLNQDNLLYNNENTTVNGYKDFHDHVGDNVKTERKNDSGNYFGMFQYYSGKLESLSISYNERTNNYQVTPVVKVHNEAKLYAKNGSCRTDGTYPNIMHEKGITTISCDKNVEIDNESSSSYQLAYLSEDNIKDEVKLTITTQVKDPENYYLAGWCVDGETYLPKTSDTENNKYSFDYYVKSTTKPNDTIEVTPVYFYKTSPNTETVRFYVTGFDDTVKKDWGNTIAVYPYYTGTGGHVFSNYPGQPMLMSGGRYYVDLPIKYNGGRIAGVTLNNYYFDDVHKNLVSNNRQTYDYNDFLKIYEQKIEGSTGRKSQEIIFSFKYVPSGTGYNNNFGDKSTNKGDKASKTYPDTILAKDMEKVYKNGWEDLTDFYGNKVDLYNQKVNASTEAGKKNPWRVISNGYEQTYFGYYATRWAVYKPKEETGVVTSYSLVDVISSSSLLYNSYEDISKDETKYTAGDQNLSASSDAEAYQAFMTNGAKGVPVKITYEQTLFSGKSIEGGPSDREEKAFRNDGRWYYSEDNLDVTAHTVIEYADTLDGFSGTLGQNFFRDYYQKDGEDVVDYTKAGYDSSKYTGLETKTSAYFTNEDYYQKTEANGRTGSDKTFDIIANTDHASQYIFVGWYLLSEGKYSPLTATVENSVSVPQDNNDVYVARFIKAPSGSLTISHTLHPDATGLGKCYVSVDVLNSAGAVIHHYDETTSDITVSNEYIKYGKGNKIKITLRTEPGEASSFIDFYSSEFVELVNTETGAVPAVTVTKDATNDTYKAEISFDVDDYLFDKDSTDYQQKIKVLKYYSQLSLGRVKYEIRYTFDTRLYGTKVYKVSGELTKEDIDTYHCTETELSKSFVLAKAPFESNFKQKITWESDKIEFDSKGGTLTAAITAKQVEDKEVTATFYVNSDSFAETITTTFGDRFFKGGSYISADATGTTAKVDGLPTEYQNREGNFSFWYVMTKNNNEFVTKAYGEKFAYTGYDNYIVVAVYGVGGTHKDELTNSSINFLQYSRNHWNDTVSGNDDDTGSYSYARTEYDRLYADFNLMFNHNGWLLNNYSGDDIRVGYAMVVGSKTDGDYAVNADDLKTAISKNATNGGNVEHQSESVTVKQAVKVTDSDNDSAKKNVIVNSIRIADLDNKNRITSYYGFKNSDANQSYYVKVYSYVIVDNEVTLSETPVVINLNDIGNKTYEPKQ